MDFGCGIGTHSFRLAAQFGCRVTGIDICEGNLKVAMAECGKRGMEKSVFFENADIEKLPYKDLSFSLLWGRDILIHVKDLAGAFRECFRVLAPGGKMIVFTTLATSLLFPEEIDKVKKIRSGEARKNQQSGFQKSIRSIFNLSRFKGKKNASPKAQDNCPNTKNHRPKFGNDV